MPDDAEEANPRTLIEEIRPRRRAPRSCAWSCTEHGGCHTAQHAQATLGVALPTRRSRMELITKMARRHRDDQIARVLSPGTAHRKGNRGRMPRVATVRRSTPWPAMSQTSTPMVIVTLGKATEHTGVSDLVDDHAPHRRTHSRRPHIAPYAPLELFGAPKWGVTPVAGIFEALEGNGEAGTRRGAVG